MTTFASDLGMTNEANINLHLHSSCHTIQLDRGEGAWSGITWKPNKWSSIRRETKIVCSIELA